MTMRLDTLLFEACAKFGDTPALEDDRHRVSYRELDAASQILADDLRNARLQANEPVLVPVANTPQDIAAFLGVWAAGGVAVPVVRNAPDAALERTRVATGARLAVADNGKARRLGDHPPPSPRPLLEGAALIIFTSGSTGVPKGVALGHAAFAGKLREIDGVLCFSQRTRALLVLQITFVFGIWFSLLTLMKGGRLFMRSRFDPVTVIGDLGERQITDVAFVPTMMRRMLAAEPMHIRPLLERIALKRICTGGEPLNSALNRAIREMLRVDELIDIYGLTETSSSDFFCTGDDGGIGRCSKSETFRIADARGRVVPAGEVGELQIATPFIMNGYLDQPGLTRNAFSDGFFRTGDLARLRADGNVELVGRGKDLIVRSGVKVSPLELDGIVAQHPAVAAALTVGVADGVVGERIHVLVVPRAEGAVGEQDLRAWVAARLERFKQPDAYHFGSELPTGRTGKADRDALRRSIVTYGRWRQD